MSAITMTSTVKQYQSGQTYWIRAREAVPLIVAGQAAPVKDKSTKVIKIPEAK